MNKALDKKFAKLKAQEAKNIDAHLQSGWKWLRSRLSEVKSEKSRAAAGDDWLKWHAAECALMDEIATRQKREGIK